MPRTYQNMIDYVQTQLDTFAQRDVCRVDSLVFSWLVYFRLPEGVAALETGKGVALKDLFRADWFDEMCGPLYDTESSIELLTAVAASPRFRDVWVSGYESLTDERAEQQFAAMTFQLSMRETFIAFRGTDNTLVGWNEDFNMAFSPSVPSQMEAVRYVENVASRTSGRLWCGGHSKGGNLAVYAGMNCADDTFERIVRCYSHDGPGFSAECMAQGRWESATRKVDKTIPQSSIIGMVFERQESDYRVVRSHGTGFSQHDPFSWEVDLRDFVYEERLGSGASYFNGSMNEWLQESDAEQRERFVNVAFEVLGASGEDTFAGIKAHWRQALPKILVAVAALDPDERSIAQEVLAGMGRAMMPDWPKADWRQVAALIAPQMSRESGLPEGSSAE